MAYFKNISSYENLKSQYRTLALANHPDAGGDVEIMKAINSEYDKLFPIWKHRSEVTNNETAYSTRSEFYTQNGWKGENYNSNISTKEIACIMREYVKDVHNDYRFSVRSDYNEICITMTEAPEHVFTGDDKYIQVNHYYVENETRLTAPAREVMRDVLRVLNSYRRDDSDGMIDYFDTNFYISINVGNYENGVKIVPRTKKKASGIEYETVEVIKTRTKKFLEPKEIEAPTEFKEGQRFILKAGFNYGCYRGAVYQIDRISEAKTIHSYKMGIGYKNVCKGNVRGNSFSCTSDKLKMWVEKGAIAFIELVEVEKTEEYTSSIRRPKKQTGVSTEVREPQAGAQESNTPKDYTITPDTDTRDNSLLWVVRFTETMSREAYKETAAIIKTLGGYYSKFKHGFIFKEDPTDRLNNQFNEDHAESEEQKDGIKDHCKRCACFNIDCAGHGEPWTGCVYFKKKSEAPKPKTYDKTKVIDRIQKSIESTDKKIAKLSGDYLTNTYKRMREQESREAKISGYRIDLDILNHLLNTAEERELTTLENALITEAFRDKMHSYYKRSEMLKQPEGARPSNIRPVKYPEIDPEYPNSWWNTEVPKMQKQLQRAGIADTEQLIKAIEEYTIILNASHKPIDQRTQQIKKLERECRMMQKGDINFTPPEVAKKLIEYAEITEDSKVLEPSAGTGVLADAAREITNDIDVIERMSTFRELLTLKGYNLVGDDFLQYQSEPIYDAIIMNPPFSDEQNHIKHAYSMLKDGGLLVAISSPHWTFAQDKKSTEFRNWIGESMLHIEDLQSGTFEMTGVAAKIIVLRKETEAERQTA